MKKLFITLLGILVLGTLVSCEKQFDEKIVNLKYEVSFIETAPLVRKSDAQLVGLLTGGIAGYLIGDVATDVLDNTGLESTKNNVTLALKDKSYNLKSFNYNSIILENVPKEIDLKVKDTLTIPARVLYYKDRYGNVYHVIKFVPTSISSYTSWTKE